MRRSRIIKDYTLTLCHIYGLHFLSCSGVFYEFALDSHSVQVAHVLHYVSNKFKVSTAFRFRAKSWAWDRQTDRRVTTL